MASERSLALRPRRAADRQRPRRFRRAPARPGRRSTASRRWCATRWSRRGSPLPQIMAAWIGSRWRRDARPDPRRRRAAPARCRCRSPHSRARSRRAGIARLVGQGCARCAPPGRSRIAGARTRYSRPISTWPAFAARRRGSARRRCRCSARRPTRSPGRCAAARGVAARSQGRPDRHSRGAPAPMSARKGLHRFAGGARTMLGPSRSLALDPGLAPHLADAAADQAGRG
jgi:hypothetical protein